jgi:alkanesulfonate monooxygenase SsuD/methylene tetrahydromethanopterin reductase-like flavin-dependent oxidoreductase (luciferase family)
VADQIEYRVSSPGDEGPLVGEAPQVGVAIPTRDWPSGRPWSFIEMAEFGTRAEKLGFDSLWVYDHFLSTTGNQSANPDPFVLLAYLAARTHRVLIGSLVACAAFRSPGQLVREAKTLSELSMGRFILGLGAGWLQREFEAFDFPFDRRVSRFEEFLSAVIQLFNTPSVDFDGQFTKLRQAQVRGGRVPPVWIGGSGPRMIRLAAKHANGWHPNARLGQFQRLVGQLRREEHLAGRAPGSVRASVGLRALVVSKRRNAELVASHPDLDETVALGSTGLFDSFVRLGGRGCQHLILHLSGELWSNYGGVMHLESAAHALRLPRPD